LSVERKARLSPAREGAILAATAIIPAITASLLFNRARNEASD
jgi:hypothetical protein